MIDVPAWRRREVALALGLVSLDYLKGIDDAVASPDVLRDCREGRHEWLGVSVATGEVFPLRCKSPNKCSYCRELGARETVELLDIAAGDAPPTVFVVLTTSEFVTREQLRRDLCQLRRAARRRWPAFQYFCALEWQKRGAIHVNLLVRGCKPTEAWELMDCLWPVWKARHRADVRAQDASPIRSPRHAAAYVHKLGGYLHKSDQGAPPGWRGHRSSQTRGYLGRPAAEVRMDARESLVWKALRAPYLRAGVRPLEASWRACDEYLVHRIDIIDRIAAVALAPRTGPPGDLVECDAAAAESSPEQRPSRAVERDVEEESVHVQLALAIPMPSNMFGPQEL